VIGVFFFSFCADCCCEQFIFCIAQLEPSSMTLGKHAVFRNIHVYYVFHGFLCV
jgi:hypothetical protein